MNTIATNIFNPAGNFLVTVSTWQFLWLAIYCVNFQISESLTQLVEIY